jgi:hypothetical protein
MGASKIEFTDAIMEAGARILSDAFDLEIGGYRAKAVTGLRRLLRTLFGQF